MTREQARQRIMRATVQTLAAQGHARATARAIARTGGFAPGVIYYHFTDLTDLFAATLTFTSDARLARYRAQTMGISGAAELVRRLRALYAEDHAEGHIAAVQELVAAAVSSPQLAEQVRAATAAWQELAREIISRFATGTPIAPLVPVAELATAAVATYLGMEMLSHLDADHMGAAALFDAAEHAAALFDALRPAQLPRCRTAVAGGRGARPATAGGGGFRLGPKERWRMRPLAPATTAVLITLAAAAAAAACTPQPLPAVIHPTACSTPARPWLRAGGQAAGAVRWVVRLASCFTGNQAISLGLPTTTVGTSPALTVALFGNHAWGVDTASGRVRWSVRVPLHAPPVPQSGHTEYIDPQVAVLPHDVVIAEDMNQSGSAAPCCGRLAVADLNPATGATRRARWLAMPRAADVQAQIIGGKVAFIATAPYPHASRGRLGVADPASGKIWTRRYGAFDAGSITAVGNVLYADQPNAFTTERSLLAYALPGGARLRPLRLPAPALLLGSAGGLILASTQSHGVEAVNPVTGRLAWRTGTLYASGINDAAGAVWGWSPSERLAAYDLRTGRPRRYAPISRRACEGVQYDPAAPEVTQDLYFAVTGDTVLCPEPVNPRREVLSVVRLGIFSLATGQRIARTVPLPDWSSDNLAGGLAVGVTCQGPSLPSESPTTTCDEYDLAAINTR